MQIAQALITAYANEKDPAESSASLLCPLMNVLKYYSNYLDCCCFYFVYECRGRYSVFSMNKKISSRREIGIINADTFNLRSASWTQTTIAISQNSAAKLRSLLNESKSIAERRRTKECRAFLKGARNSVLLWISFKHKCLFIWQDANFGSLDYSTYANEKDPAEMSALSTHERA
ncbi:hypothetical protein CEXT_421041 [Caerostris extrusa]|uniref:Uncharacterized protein n=1 Tax=Caerostris extrusa TaxID=172846 RepID=A0AAV4S125_CAEEX|nr:hypothetical protein CEXT_421041 [Caerostris extrusa]